MTFDDARRGMGRLADAGYELAILSNGDPEMLDTLVETLDVADVGTTTISAEEVEAFTPGAELYEHAADRLGAPVDRVAHVGAGWGDIMGAIHAGMRGVWLNRKEVP